MQHRRYRQDRDLVEANGFCQVRVDRTCLVPFLFVLVLLIVDWPAALGAALNHRPMRRPSCGEGLCG
jgi:hypothetical protein